MEPPTVQTNRLVMREWRDDDFAGYCALAGDPEVARFIGGMVDDAHA